MAEKLMIEIFRRMDAEDFTKALADPESRTAVGSGAAHETSRITGTGILRVKGPAPRGMVIIVK